MANAISDLGSRLSQAANGLSGPPMRKTLTAIGVAAKKDMDEAARAATGGDAVMSNWKGAKLTSAFQVTGTSITVIPRPAGPWKVLDQGAAAHVVRPKGRGRRQAVSTPYGPRAQVRIPHTRGKQAWSKGRRAVQTRTPDRLTELVGGELRSVLHG